MWSFHCNLKQIKIFLCLLVSRLFSSIWFAFLVFVIHLIISGLWNSYLIVNFCDIQLHLLYCALRGFISKILEKAGKKVWSLIDPVNWTIQFIGKLALYCINNHLLIFNKEIVCITKKNHFKEKEIKSNENFYFISLLTANINAILVYFNVFSQ